MSETREELPREVLVLLSPKKPQPATAVTGGPLSKDHHHSEQELRRPLNFLNQNKKIRKVKSDNFLSISKKLNFSDLDVIPEEGKESKEKDGNVHMAGGDEPKPLEEPKTEVKEQMVDVEVKTENACEIIVDIDITPPSPANISVTFNQYENKLTGPTPRTLDPIAEEITDLLCKPLAISPISSSIIATCVDSPTTTSLAKSVRALSVKTPLSATATTSGDNQQAPDSIKRPVDPSWTFGSSPTTSRPSKRQKSMSCDVLMQDLENPVRRFAVSRTHSLHRSQSDPEAILRAIQQSETDPLLIGDSSKHYALPILTDGKHSDLKEISPDTMKAVLTGDYSEQLSSYQIIDCRYPYEFTGGHITGALNLYTQTQIHEKFLANLTEVAAVGSGSPTSQRHILIFHCEFSSQRAPNMCRFVRDFDRTMNKDFYPALHYPELYILHGGYKLFYESHPQHCTPSAYLPMAHDDHIQELSYYKNKAKEELIKASCGGTRTAAPSFMNSQMMKQRKTTSFNRLCF